MINVACLLKIYSHTKKATVAQLVKWLAMGWMTSVCFPVGAESYFFATTSGDYPASFSMGTRVSFAMDKTATD